MLSKQQQACRCGQCGDEGKGGRHNDSRGGCKGGYVDLNDTRSRDLSSREEGRSHDGSMISFSSATAASFIGPSLVSPSSQQHSSSHLHSSSLGQASWQPQSVNVQRRRKDNTSNHRLLSNSLPQAPSSWHGGNKKRKAILRMPVIAPPLTSGTDTNTYAPPPPPPRRHGEGKGDRHFIVELNDTRSRDRCDIEKTKSRDGGSVNSFLSAMTTTASSTSSKIGIRLKVHRYHSPDPPSSTTRSSQLRPSSSYQQASPSQRTRESPRQDSWHPQPVHVRSRNKDDKSNNHRRRLLSNSLLQAPASWYGGNKKKKKSILKVPRMFAPPPLTGSADTNSAASAQSKTDSSKDKSNLREDEKGGIIDSELRSPSHSLDGLAFLLEGLMREDDDGSSRSGW